MAFAARVWLLSSVLEGVTELSRASQPAPGLHTRPRKAGFGREVPLSISQRLREESSAISVPSSWSGILLPSL